MSAVNLKARAKRLRTAITAMFKVPVSVAQSLELVAQEENFPTWDAASASSGRTDASQSPAVPAYQGTTASNFLSKLSQHGSFIVAPSGSGKHLYALHTMLDQLRLGKTVVAVDRGMSYLKLTELIGGTYHHLQADGNQEVRCFGNAPLVVYDFDKMPAAGQATWAGDLPDLPADFLTANGFFIIDEAWAIKQFYPGAIALLTTVAQAGGSYCVVGQRDEDVREFTVAVVPFMTTVRLKHGPPLHTR